VSDNLLHGAAVSVKTAKGETLSCEAPDVIMSVLRKYFLAAELSIYEIVCHLKLLMRHLLIHSKTDLIDSG